MNIIEKQIDESHPYEHNPRRNDDAVDAVAASIKEFGFKVPIVIDKDGTVVTGHTRLKAAKKLGFKTVPCILADDLSEEQVKAFRLADNKTAELADWDFEMLDDELAKLGDIDMTQFGFADLDEEQEMPERKEMQLPGQNYSVVIDCKNEDDQEKTYDKLVEEGYTCRLSTF